MRCAIMQPSFFPWLGFYNLIHQSDCFIFLDDVQFARQSWQCRNRILINETPVWIHAGIMKSPLSSKIKDVRLKPDNLWQEKILAQLRSGYLRHPFYPEVIEFLTDLFSQRHDSLSKFNIELILGTCKQLDLKINYKKASLMHIDKQRTSKVIGLCKAVGATVYVAPEGSKEYLSEDKFESQTEVALTFQDYHVQEYNQLGVSNFFSHLSIVDAVMNIGWDRCRQYILI